MIRPRFFWPAVFALCCSCAIQVAPQGGERDAAPPKLLRAEPEDRTVNFRGNAITLQFDEYVQLKDAAGQFVVSPPMRTPPVVKARKKSILVTWEDTLAENATYTFSFGNSIVDNNEGNPVADYQLVLGTGPVIDSLEVSGRVESAFDLTTASGVLVMLFRDRPDTVPFEALPANFSKTGADGRFRIRNVSPGSYFLMAVKDINGNYRYDGGEEEVGFLDSTFTAPAADLSLRLFREVPALHFIRGYSVSAGKTGFAFTAPVLALDYAWLTDSAYLDPFAWEFNARRDTVHLWYRHLQADTVSIVFRTGGRSDTCELRLFRQSAKAAPVKRFGVEEFRVLSFAGREQHRYLPLQLEFRQPVLKFDTTLFRLLEDSLPVAVQPVPDDPYRRRFSVFHPWKDGSTYRLSLMPGAFTDLFGNPNDTTELRFAIRGEREYGNLTFALRLKRQGLARLLQLVGEGGQVVRETPITGDSVLTWNHLDPGLYRVKLIDDDNANGKWDTGNYLEGRQPEKVQFAPESIPLRANWDADIRWTEGQ